MINICLQGPTGSPTYPLDDNPSYFHRVTGDNVCGLNMDTTHAHKQSNTNPCREYFKVSGSHCRKVDLLEASDGCVMRPGCIL